MRKLRVIIVGGGIGGCTLALSLRQITPASLRHILNPVSPTLAGQPDASHRVQIPPVSSVTASDSIFSTTVFEQAPRIEAVGAGISLAPNGLRVMEALGLYGSLKELGGPISCLHSYSDDGSFLRTQDMTYLTQRYGYPLLALERAELQALLIHEVMAGAHEGAPPPIVFGKKCVAVQPLGRQAGVRVHFTDGSVEEADLVVGGDGLKSAVRAALTSLADSHDRRPRRGSAVYSGISCILGVTDPVPGWQPGSAYAVYGPGRVYGSWSMGRSKQYWYLAEQELVTADNLALWSTDDALKGLDEMWNWHHPYNAHALFSRTTRAVKVGFFEVPRAVPMVGGGGGGRSIGQERSVAAGHCIALIGDAAHAMLPTINQGGNASIEDAAVLARALAMHCAPSWMKDADSSSSSSRSIQHPSLPAHQGPSFIVNAALEDYSKARASRVRQLMAMSRSTAMWQTSYNPVVQALHRSILRWSPESIMQQRMDWAFGYKAEGAL